MTERLFPSTDRFPEASVTRSVVGPGKAVYSIDDEVVVAAVHGRHVQLLDAEGVVEELTCASPEAAGHEALGYALLLQRPLMAPEEAP
jgi:hypothetical protein